MSSYLQEVILDAGESEFTDDFGFEDLDEMDSLDAMFTSSDSQAGISGDQVR